VRDIRARFTAGQVITLHRSPQATNPTSIPTVTA